VVIRGGAGTVATDVDHADQLLVKQDRNNSIRHGEGECGRMAASVTILSSGPRRAWKASAVRDGTVQRGGGLWADPTVNGETIRFLESDDGRFRSPTENPVGRTGVVAGA